MKKITLIALMLFTALGYAQVGINTNNPDVSSALEIESTTGGILIPRMTELQRDAISSPATGLMVYQSDNNFGFYFYNGAQWTNVAMSGPAGPQGEVGPQGQQGEQGPAGNDGQDGVDGAVGAQGIQGETGATGPTGPVGAQGIPGSNGIDGVNGSSAYEIWLSLGNTGSGQDFIDSLTGPQGEQGSNGQSGASSILFGTEITCESAQQLDVGTMVYSTNNASGSLNIVTPGPDCFQTPTKLFSTPQTISGYTSSNYYWFFNVSESIYVYDLPTLITNQFTQGYSSLRKLQDFSGLDPAVINSYINNSQLLLRSGSNSSSYTLLEPGAIYCLEFSGANGSNTRLGFSTGLPPYDESLFISLGQFEYSYSTSTYFSTTRLGMGVNSELQGFSYSSPGKVFQTIVDW